MAALFGSTAPSAKDSFPGCPLRFVNGGTPIDFDSNGCRTAVYPRSAVAASELPWAACQKSQDLCGSRTDSTLHTELPPNSEFLPLDKERRRGSIGLCSAPEIID